MIRTAVFAVTLAFAGTSALAQSATTTTAPAKSTAPAKKPAPAKKAAPAAAPEKPLPPADQAQLDAAERTYFGKYDCEFNQTMDVGMNPKYPGYVNVVFKGRTFVTKPVLSSTGALRLEDTGGVGLVLQIANKSMLMDTRQGVRLVDACMHEKHKAFEAAQQQPK